MSPTTVASSSSAGSSKADRKGHALKTRVVRRRGRGRMEGVESDDEIERAAMSDASDSDDSIESDVDSDSEAESTMQANGHIKPDTPSTTQSPPPPKASNESSSTQLADPPRSAPAFFSDSGRDWMGGSSSGNWSDMVAEEGANGTAQLPVIDFGDLDETAVDAPAHQDIDGPGDEGMDVVNSTEAAARQDDVTSAGNGDGPRRGSARGGAVPRRPFGRAVRQQYQQKLQTDPSFVPTVGEFWGHDPRLIPEDMRSMSDWWRDRKFARGRGGGFASRGFRGRGRGGFYPRSHATSTNTQSMEDNGGPQESPASPNVPSIDRAWTHDGFEEMKRRDDRHDYQKRVARPTQRRADVSPTTSSSSRGGYIHNRGRGTFAPARGSFQARRGAFSPNASRPNPDRIWYATKPERTWTKQLETFLHFDGAGKPWIGRPAGFRVHLPGKRVDFVKTAVKPQSAIVPADVRTQANSETGSVTEREKTYVVRLPTRETKETDVLEVVCQESFTTVEQPSFDEPLATSKAVVEFEKLKISSPSAPVSPVTRRAQPARTSTLAVPSSSEATPSTPGLTRENSLSEASVQEPPVGSPSSVVPEQGNVEAERPLAPQLPPLQTVFPPPNQPSPSYASPFGYPAQLPPGVAINAHGYPYEVASGRPVFLQPTPPPVPLYNPRPVSHHNIHNGVPFVPGHMHHTSLPPDFMPMHTHSPPVNGYVDPQTGVPLFSMPRQSSRIEIRAPSDTNDGIKSKGGHKPSGLRNSTVNGEQFTGATSVQQQHPTSEPLLYVPGTEYYSDYGRAPQMYQAPQDPGNSPNGDASQLQQPAAMDPNVMGYGGYQQYYYPDYGYPAYMPQQTQYDPYGGDPNQPPVYY